VLQVDLGASAKHTSTSMLDSRWRRATLAALMAALLYLPMLGRPPLLEPDEGRYAEIAREMLVSGDFLTPHNDWVRYFEKPPLVYWITAGSLRIFGRNEFAVRLPEALFTAAEVGVTELLGELLFGMATGVLSALALALSPIVIGFARFATLDPALAFFVASAIVAFYAGLEAGWSSSRGKVLSILSGVLLGLGTMVKGPVALVLGAGVGLLYLICTGRADQLRRFPWIRATIAYAAIVLPWFVLAARANPGFLHFFFIHEHVERYLESTEHGWGPYFFVIVAIFGTWPWLYFAANAIARLWRQPRSIEDRRALTLLLLWFLFVLVFFSIPRSKLGSYILPAIPPVAVLAGYGLHEYLMRPPSRAFVGWFIVLNAVPAVIGAILLATFAARIPRPLVIDGAFAAGSVMFIALAPALATRAGWRGIAVGAITIGMLGIAGAAAKAREDSASFYSYRRLAGVVAHRLQPGCFLGSYRHFVQSLPFYTGTRETLIDYRGELAPFSDDREAAPSFLSGTAALERAWSATRCAVVIVNFSDLKKIWNVLDPRPSFLGCEGKKIALYNQPSQKPPAMFDCRATPDQAAYLKRHAGVGMRPATE
jgi:4-amino-4-deoxy-L-arabinose transferase-like glycosyltransferase